MDRTQKRSTIHVSDGRLAKLRQLIELTETMCAPRVTDNNTPQGMVDAAIDIACAKLKEFIAVQQAVTQASEPEHSGEQAQPHTLYRVIVPDELMDQCKDRIDEYLELNPESAQAGRLSHPVTPEIVVGEALQNFKSVLTGEYAEMIRREIEREDEALLEEDVQDPYSDEGHRYIPSVSELIH